MTKENEIELEGRIDKAVALFMEGYNCSQSVFCAFADMYGIDMNLATRISASFGAGIGRMRETCGTASGLFLLLGLESGSTVGADAQQKAKNYEEVQKMAARFKVKNGSLICAELLGLKKRPLGEISTTPEARTPDYYKKRPCVRMVENAARMWVDYLIERDSCSK